MESKTPDRTREVLDALRRLPSAARRLAGTVLDVRSGKLSHGRVAGLHIEADRVAALLAKLDGGAR